MSGRCPPLPASIAASLTALLRASPDGNPPDRSEAFKAASRAASSMADELIASLAQGTAQIANDTIKFAVSPSPHFRAPGHQCGEPIALTFFRKSGRFISTAAPAARIGFLDLAAHVWALRAPAAQHCNAETRFLALIGLAFLQAAAEQPPRSSEAA